MRARFVSHLYLTNQWKFWLRLSARLISKKFQTTQEKNALRKAETLSERLHHLLQYPLRSLRDLSVYTSQDSCRHDRRLQPGNFQMGVRRFPEKLLPCRTSSRIHKRPHIRKFGLLLGQRDSIFTRIIRPLFTHLPRTNRGGSVRSSAGNW